MTTPTKKQRRPKRPNVANPITAQRDVLDREALAQEYGWSLNLIYSIPELRQWFEDSVRYEWTPAQREAKLRGLKWYQDNDQYARTAWAAQSFGGADWQSQVDTAKLAVKQAAVSAGVDLTAPKLESLTQQYIFGGWGNPSRAGLLMKALSEEISTLPDKGLIGKAGTFTDQLKAEAIANGIRYSDEWYLNAAKSVTRGDTTEDDWFGEIKDKAAGLFPIYADRIRQGFSMQQIASPYVNRMADILEIAPEQITLNDPYIREALMGIDDKGNPKPMGLWDFEKRLKNDPRWMNTKNAVNDVSSVATDVLRIFGLRG
jgi:hypothetical protein